MGAWPNATIGGQDGGTCWDDVSSGCDLITQSEDSLSECVLGGTRDQEDIQT